LIINLWLLQNHAISSNKRPFIYTVAIVGILIFSNFSLSVDAQKRGINWYEICKNPIIDRSIAEPCSTLTTNGGYTLTPEGERVLACIGGGAAAILAGIPQLLALKNEVGCGTGSQSSSSSAFSKESGSGSDPIGDLIDSLLG
jgi:hypothetical protein